MVTTRSLKLGDIELAWEEQGEGTPVVFVHGAIVDRRVWRQQRDEFARRYRFVSYDQRHHGESSRGAAAGPYSLAQHAEDLQALLRAIGGGPAHVVGFSYGANVVLTALLAAPDLVSKAVLVEPALDTVLPRDAVSHEAIAPRNETLKAVGAELQRGDDAAAMRLLAEWTDNGHTAGWEAADPHYLAMLEANVPTLRMLFAAPPGDPIDCAKLQKVKVPTLVINGSETQPFYSLVGKRVAACIPAAESVILGGASHDSANQVPALFNATILEFLERGDS